ncbi:hypothetical protein [Rhizobium leguminosarum]|uniref:hypothetical protein n=1 Tax=Rhizobium leguminosarum TaxID=384 RepID=UPI001039A703|nr:hypothetical protein [Rhizobium leguminosarum]TBZ06270.1 hypothetical protein E0H38_33200 [Rhizobium leguminosarum bv. viciae]
MGAPLAVKGFTWERGPFSICAACKQESFGFLRAGGHSLTMRCSKCRYSENVALPPVDKKVIYLDQFIFSLLFNVTSQGRLPLGHETFSKALHERLRRLVLLQQIVLPHSDIHRDETTVFHSASALREAYEFIGGDISFSDTSTIELNQVLNAAEAFVRGTPLTIDLSVDEVLESNRNDWLSDMHISVRSDYSQLADGLRKMRDETHAEMEKLAARWVSEKPSFDDVLKIELDAVLQAKIGALASTERKKASADPDVLFNAVNSPIQREVRNLLHFMREEGVSANEAGQKVRDLWGSEVYRQLPHHRISAYLFAAIARRVVSGQKSVVNKGMINDVRAIATYAPYVDAMFVDKTSAQLLQERPLSDDLSFKADVFSFSSRDEFLAHLDDLEAKTPSDVREMSSRIYGLA